MANDFPLKSRSLRAAKELVASVAASLFADLVEKFNYDGGYIVVEVLIRNRRGLISGHHPIIQSQ